jgi:triacylglycerol lipase
MKTQKAKFLISLIKNLYAAGISGELSPIPNLELVDSFSLPFDENKFLGAIYSEKDKMYIIYRGTEGILEELIDIQYPQKEYKKCLVHQGFLNTYLDFKNKILLALDKLKPKKIYISGHSLGAALACITSLDVESNNVYLFACPRVGNEEFAKKTEHVFNVQNLADVIPQLPLPITPFIGKDYIYYTSGILYYFQDNLGNYIKNHSLVVYSKNIDVALDRK